MAEVVCRGLPGNWLNAWLAAVGSTVLDDRLRLRWTTESSPIAVLSTDGPGDPLDILAGAWPTRERLEAMPIANEIRALAPMGRKIGVDVFIQRAREFRGHQDVWTLSSTVTDLGVGKNGEVMHAPLDPPVPKGIWMHQRLLSVYEKVSQPDAELRKSCNGSGKRVASNGLGFDIARITTQADGSEKLVDPVIEVLAFFGLVLLPVRSNGVDARLPGVRTPEARQRGWRSTRPRAFEWPAWGQELDSAGIDALLDAWHDSLAKSNRGNLGVHASWQTVGYRWRGSSDSTRGYGSKRRET